MMHDGIAGDRDFNDPLAGYAGLARGLTNQRLHGRAHRARQLLFTAGVHHHIGDAAHQIFAEADLRVHQTVRCEHVAGFQIAEMRGNRCRADVEGDAEGSINEAGIYRDDFLALAHGGGDFPFAGPQGFLQACEHRKRASRIA